ncbi:DUF2690 domain-containing protein [Kitasatospora sp. NPDC096147]|uniref:DUF2690 domain-containing protein n=1 Tax=Kitasatospora sp. NPDC096147 TaxID=3364093 RepID=UPI003809E8AA
MSKPTAPARLLAVLTASLALTATGFAVAPAQPAVAAACTGAGCNGKDPEATGCARDGKLLESRTWGQPGNVKVQLYSSAACKAKWARSVDAPSGGAVMVANRDYTVKHVRKTDGAKKYVWTPMVNGNATARACVGPQDSDALTCTGLH